ncbi:hypothetical protein BJX70DRAFT_396990 [Aspergillus crustosus]
MRTVIFSLMLALFALVASTHPTTDTHQTPSDVDLTDQTFEVRPSPGAPPVLLNGTLDEIHAKLLEINPNYDDEDWEDVRPPLITRANMPRNPNKNVNCAIAKTSSRYARENIEWIRKMDDRSGGKPIRGPGKCQRTRCMQDSAIYWCNMADHQKTLPAFRNIADGAQVILNNCAAGGKVGGIHWHNDLWAVVIKPENCYPVNHG